VLWEDLRQMRNLVFAVMLVLFFSAVALQKQEGWVQ
jgi:hypothetical protein